MGLSVYSLEGGGAIVLKVSRLFIVDAFPHLFIHVCHATLLSSIEPQ
jgi:hypothetical protein